MSGTLLLIARLVLAGVFLVAGIAKLADRSGTREAAAAFGVPRALAGAVAVLLPLAEIAVAAALLPAATAVAAACGALVLLAVFVGGIGRSLARGEAPDCRCFGQLHSSPAGWPTLARNLALAAVAAAIVAGGIGDPGPSAVAWLGELEGPALAAVGAGAAALAVLTAAAWVVMRVLRSHGRLLLRIEALEDRLAAAGMHMAEPAWQPELTVSEPAPRFELEDTEGREVALASLLDGERPLVLLLNHPQCGPCRELLPFVADWQRTLGDRLELAVLSAGDAASVRVEQRELGLHPALIDEDGQVAERYGAAGTPSAALVEPGGQLLRPLAAGPDEVRSLVQRAVQDRQEAAGLDEGEPVPALELPTLDGGTFALDGVRGRRTLLVFWNPGCGFCEQMRDELLAWEARRGPADPRLVVVASGDTAAVAAEGFRSLVVLDPDGRAGEAFAAGGTPMAVLIDAAGRIASPVAAGRDAVLELAGAAPAPVGS